MLQVAVKTYKSVSFMDTLLSFYRPQFAVRGAITCIRNDLT